MTPPGGFFGGGGMKKSVLVWLKGSSFSSTIALPYSITSSFKFLLYILGIGKYCFSVPAGFGHRVL